MTDTVGLYAGIRPIKNASEYGYFDMNVGGTSFAGNNAPTMRNIAPGYFTPPPKPQREFNDVIFRSTLAQVLPLVGRNDTVRFGKCESDKNAYMYPSQGYARGQQKGLAYDADKPIDGNVMPITGFYNINQTNVLGGLKD